MTFIPGPTDPLVQRQPPVIVFAQSSAPASEPVTVATFRAYAHLDDNDDSTALTALLLAARHVVEQFSGRVLAAQNWTAKLETWPALGADDGRIRIRLNPPPLSITSVTVDGAAVASTVYALRGNDIVFGPDLSTYPTGETAAGGIVITFAASPGATAYPQLLTAIQMLAAHWHRNPEASHTFEAGLSAMPLGFGALINSAKVMRELN